MRAGTGTGIVQPAKNGNRIYLRPNAITHITTTRECFVAQDRERAALEREAEPA
jgi:hypothetical protein